MVEKKVQIEGKPLLRFGIMCSGYVFQKWQGEIINLLIANRIEPVLLIFNDRQPANQSLFNKIVSYPYKNILFRIYNRYFFKPHVRNSVDLYAQLKEIETINCCVSRIKHSEYFSEVDINQIKNYQLDFILRFGFNIIRGDILYSSKYGVWSFHHGDDQYYRGGPAGLWEILKNDPVNGAILQRLTDELDAGIILKKGIFQTIKHSWKNNINHVYSSSSIWPLQVCKDILNNNADYFDTKPSGSKARIFKNPVNLIFIVFLFKLILNKLIFHLKD
ncbi:hypothetical protein ACFL6I_27870, partial [candidate division KSB1 bacterium]